MKSKINKDRFIIECGCGSPDHLLVIDLFEDGDYSDDKSFSDISFYFTSNWTLPLWKRLIVSFKYIFFKEPFFAGDSVHIDKQNIEELEEMTARLRTFLKLEK